MNKGKNANTLGIAVSIIGASVMVGWVTDITLLKSILPIWVTMKFSTALSFFLSGITLICINTSTLKGKVYTQIVLPITTLTILLLMTTLLASVFLGMRTGIEDLFVSETEGAIKSTTPGRPSVGTMINFILIGVAGILTMLNIQTLRAALFFIGTVVGFLGAVAIVGYLIKVPPFYYAIEGFSSAMAFHTAILFVMMGAGLVSTSSAITDTKKSF